MNNLSTLNQLKEIDFGDMKIAVNTIQRTLLVERLYIDIYYPADRIIPYDYDNLYPNKIKSIAQRSGTASGAIGTLGDFVSGDGFDAMSQVINRNGQTFWDILRFVANQKATFGGWSLHFNYNIFGEIMEIQPMPFEFVRWGKTLDRFIVNPDWKNRRRKKEEVEYHIFDPKKLEEQVREAGSLEKFNGQLYYWIPDRKDWYCVADWDSVIDDAQFEAEAKLYSLSCIQNDYSLSGLITYPKNVSDKDEIEELKKDLKKDTGSANAGGVRVVSAIPSENLTNWKWFSPISRNNIDNLHTNQKEDAKFNIYAAFRQPSILNGVATEGMFNQESFADAFHYYNSATETERKDVERELNKIIQASIWANIGIVQIKPMEFLERKKEVKPLFNG